MHVLVLLLVLLLYFADTLCCDAARANLRDVLQAPLGDQVLDSFLDGGMWGMLRQTGNAYCNGAVRGRDTRPL
jgi:hypothetical protein